MLIRPEGLADLAAIHDLVQAAFASAEHSDGTEQDLVDALRRGHAFIPELSLVAEEDETLLGHILFTKMKVGDREALALAPLAVRPGRQRQGIGSALIREGHRRAAALGYGCSVVLGSETYYPRFGYVPAEQSPRASPRSILWRCSSGRMPGPSGALSPTPRSSACDHARQPFRPPRLFMAFFPHL